MQLLLFCHDDEMWFLDYDISSSLEPQLPRLSSVLEILFQHVQNIAVAIHIDYGEDARPQTKEGTFDHRSSVADLIRPLSAFGALQKLEAHVNNSHELAEANIIGNDILDSLQELQGLKSVTVCGTSPAHATKLKTIMESSETSDSLQDMGHGLRQYLGQDFHDDEDWIKIADALGTYNVELFIQTRERIVERTEASRAALLRQVYQYDRVDAVEFRGGKCV